MKSERRKGEEDLKEWPQISISDKSLHTLEPQISSRKNSRDLHQQSYTYKTKFSQSQRF